MDNSVYTPEQVLEKLYRREKNEYSCLYGVVFYLE